MENFASIAQGSRDQSRLQTLGDTRDPVDDHSPDDAVRVRGKLRGADSTPKCEHLWHDD